MHICILAADVQSVDITDAKRKYCRCFNSILFACGESRKSLLHYILLNPTVYHACFMVVKPLSYMTDERKLMFIIKFL